MYIGDNKIIHATKVAGKVVIETMEEFAINRQVIGCGRISQDLSEERYVISVPPERLDIRIKEDLAEEIGRIIGYDKLTPSLPPLARTGLLPKRTYYENKVREILLAQGFSEVMTYTFGGTGEVELVKGLADDKEKLRTNLGAGLLQSLKLNLYNAPLLGQNTIRLFEFGNVFTKGSERKHFALTLDDGGKKSSFTEDLDIILTEMKRSLGVSELDYDTVSTKPYCIELDFDTLIDTLPLPSTYEAPTFASLPPVTYKTVSPYPFITRDIAMWVPGGDTWEDIRALCAQVSNPLITRIDLFDTFSKKIEDVEKTSFAFRLVFQSHEMTLTDEEVNEMMKPYYEVFKNKGFEIR
jgi:phenylalanyl-tRNA synthetase beta chain